MRSPSAVLCLLLAVLPLGCARRQVDPPATEQQASEPLEPLNAEASPSEEITETPVIEVLPEPIARTDGRPDWWFTTPQYVNGRVRLCAEAIGPGMSGAARNAVDAGRRKLRETLRMRYTRELPNESIESTAVAELPNPGGSNTHVGYVLISARLP